jgi:hypothetical protein
MFVKTKVKKASMNFFPGDMQNMIRDNFQVRGWRNYSESPYAIHKKGMEELGYEGIKPRNDTSDT